MSERITLDPAKLVEWCRHYRIRGLSLFGSTLKGTAHPDSDVDLLVEFEPGSRTTLFDMAQIEIEPSQLIGTSECAPPGSFRRAATAQARLPHTRVG